GNFIDAPAAPGEIARPAAANGRAEAFRGLGGKVQASAVAVNEARLVERDDLGDRDPAPRMNQPAAAPRTQEPMASEPLGRKLREAQIAQNQRQRIVGADREAEAKVMQRDDFVLVREYAHKARPGRKAGDRRDFTETLYFGPAVKTDASSG